MTSSPRFLLPGTLAILLTLIAVPSAPAQSPIDSGPPPAPGAVLVRVSSKTEPAWFIPAADGSGILVPAAPPYHLSLWMIGLITFGLIGQSMFAARFALQWIASERAGRSVVPVAFWWFSLVGSAMLLTYFAIRFDPVGLVGQILGFPIYLRNLLFVLRDRRRGVSSLIDPAEHPVPDPNAEA